MRYKDKLSNILNIANNELIELITLHGKDSKFRNDKVLRLKKVDVEVAFNLEGGRYLKEIGINLLIDNCGYEYSCDVLTSDNFLELVDHFVKKFETKKK